MRIHNREVVIKAVVGSHNYNLNTENSDEDFKYFVMPTFEDLYKGKFFSYSTQSDELDYTVHDIRKLALQMMNLDMIQKTQPMPCVACMFWKNIGIQIAWKKHCGSIKEKNIKFCWM